MPTMRYLLVVNMILVAVAGCDAAGRAGDAVTPPRPVSVLVLRESDPARQDRVAASVASWKTESIGFEVAGRVQFVIEPETDVLGRTYDVSGKLLREPTVLARLDTTRYDLEVKSVAADIEATRQQEKSIKIEIDQVFPAQKRAAEAERDLAQTEVERNQKLVAQNAAPERALDLARSKLESSAAQLLQVDAEREARRAELASMVAKREQLEQSLAEANRNVLDCTVYSPYSGQAAEVHVIPGGFVERGEPVVSVQMMDPITVEFEVARRALKRLHFRDSLPVYIPQADGFALERRATVYMTDPVADPQTRTFTVTLLMRNEKLTPQVPADMADKPLVQTTNIWPVMGQLIDDGKVLFVDELSFQEDADGAFLWKITNRSRTTLAADATPQLDVAKLRVKRGDRKVDFLGLYKFQELTIDEGQGFNLETDMVTGRMIYPKGLDAATWEGGALLFRSQRWLLRPGDLVGVDVSGQPAAPGFYVPLDAILEQSGTSYVFILDEASGESRVRQVKVRLGQSVGTQRRIEAVVEGTFKDGQTRIVAGGALFLTDDEAVNVAKEIEVGAMSLSAWAIKNRPVVLTLVGLLMMWGVYSYFNMPRREDPEYTVRTCVVTTHWPGAPATKVEELITKPLEEILDQLEEVDVVRSTTRVGMSTIYVDAEDSVTGEMIDNVWDKVRARVRRVRMPEAGIVPDVNDEFGDTSVLLLAVYQTPLEGETKIDDKQRYSLRELDIFSEKIKDDLRLVAGGAKSEQYGVVDEVIRVETDLGTWSKLNLTTDQLERLASERNIVASGGSIDTDVGRFSVNPGGEFNAVNEMESIVAGLTGDNETRRPVYLKDMGLEIKRGYVDPRQVICRFGDSETSQPAVMVALTMKSGSNIVTLCNAAKQRVYAMQHVDRTLPPNIAITAISDQSVNVEDKIWQVMSNVIGAVIIVVVVVYLVVGFRSAAVMAANIPVVVLSALALITIFGVQLEQISLASIIIALGLLVDNAVQICDQSRANQMLGMDPLTATVKGSNQVASPMLMGTATTIAAFAPMLLSLQGSRLEYLFSLPVTLSVTLAISWLLAMTFCTILAAWFIRAPKDPSRPSAPLPWLMSKVQSLFSKKSGKKPGSKDDAENGDLIDRLFRSIVRLAIRMKWVTLAVSVGLFFLAINLPYGSEYFPKDLRDQFAIQIWLPENASIEQTNEAAKKVEEAIRLLSPITDSQGQQLQRLRSMRTMVGRGGSRWYLGWDPEPAQPGFAEILVRTSNGRFTPQFAADVRRAAEQGDAKLGIEPIIGARVVPRELYMGPSSDPVEIRVSGPGFADMTTLRRFADRVKAMINEHPGTWDVNDSWGVDGYEMQVDVDEDKANLAGVSNEGIANTLNAYFSGQLLTTFREGDHQVPVYLQLKPEQRTSIDGLRNAFVEGRYGKVPLDSFADIRVGWEPLTIVRRDLNRTIEVRSQVNDGYRGNDVVLEVMKSDAMLQLLREMPGGYRVEVGGSLEESQDGIQEVGMSFGISALTIVLLLVIQYNGWAKPLIILTTLPLALIGAIPGLWITGNPLGFMPQLGILALFGIVLNTGIIFIEFADILIKEAAEKSDGSGPICGLTRDEFRECLVDAGKKRLLPIFLTTATTVGGLLPLALSGGPLWEGMSWAMIFGLLIATVLTLLVVPALYAILVETFGVKPFHESVKTE